MPGHPSWRLLPATVPGIPDLLVSAVFSADSYKLQLTDLANVWAESLDRRAIIKRGLVEDTSIDPSDGPDQLRKMLELLRAAFDANDAEHSNTSLSIASDKDDSLLVHVTCVLPKPLKPFKWPMHLAKCPHSALATQLVLPLILAHDSRAREINRLIAAFRDKDTVITRLVDKLEATGAGLEQVFNVLSGKRRVSRAAAEGMVKGLAAFSEAEFRQDPGEQQPAADPTDVSSLLDGVFGATGLGYRSEMYLEASPILNDWWTGLGKGKNVVLAARPRESKTVTPLTTQTVGSLSNDDGEDDFQNQATPPRLPSARKRGSSTRPAVVDDDETSDGEEIPDNLDITSSPAPSGKPKPSGSKLGALGGRRQISPAPQRVISPHQAAVKGWQSSANAASETASDDEDSKLEASPSPPHPPRQPQRRGLGRIGGKSAAAADPVRSPSPVTSAKADTPPRGHKLGLIGKKVNTAPPSEAELSGEDSRGRSGTPATHVKAEAQRETSQERADRKRAELREELEKRAPAKKKRKF